MADEWFDIAKRPLLEPRTADRQWARISGVLDEIGAMDIGEIRSADGLRALRAIENRGAVYTARRVRGMVARTSTLCGRRPDARAPPRAQPPVRAG